MPATGEPTAALDVLTPGTPRERTRLPRRGGATRGVEQAGCCDAQGVRAAARIDDSPCGRRRIILVLGNDLDRYATVTTRQDVELVADLWGLELADIDFTEVGDLLDGAVAV